MRPGRLLVLRLEVLPLRQKKKKKKLTNGTKNPSIENIPTYRQSLSWVRRCEADTTNGGKG